MTRIIAALLMLIATSVSAGEAIYVKTTTAATDEVYTQVYKALEEERFWVVFEANIGENNKRFAEKWGEEYNSSGLTAIRSMVVCNGWWANAVGNADPEMLALCPLRVNLTAKDGITSVLFARPTHFAGSSPAKEVLAEIEEIIIGAIDRGVAAAGK
jgi:hypothetical protein